VPTHLYLTQPVHRAARDHPDGLCLVYGARRTTNAVFRDRVARLAGAFKRIGVRTDDRVAILSLNSDRVVEAFFGCWWAGAVAAPVNVRWNLTELAYALGDCGASLLLVDDPFLAGVAALREQVPSLRAVIHLGAGPSGAESLPDGLLSYEALVEAGPAVADAGRDGDDLAFVLYTGGTTGFPKGVMLSHANLVSATMSMLAAGCGTGEIYLHAPPLFHIAGIQVMTGHFFGSGGPHIIVGSFSPVAVMSAVAEHHVTDVMLVPTMLRMVLAHPDLEKYDLSPLRRIYYGAAPMTEALLRAAMTAIPGTGFVQGYGMTETALTVMLPPWFYTAAGQKRGKLASIGRALPLAEIAIRDPAGAEVPRGTVGELTVRSASVMVGYVGKPAETAATVRDGWLYSGDAAYLDDDGFIYLVDRLKDMIITGGENVYSAEVEQVLAGHPAVAMCAVIGIPDAVWGEQVHAVVTLLPGASLPGTSATAHGHLADELIAYCRDRMAGYKCPRGVTIRDTLPLSAAGKILKTTLRAEHPAFPDA
jgi:acyl-CoA synthetase (AMP-forming)/AMP-acid ligase II